MGTMDTHTDERGWQQRFDEWEHDKARLPKVLRDSANDFARMFGKENECGRFYALFCPNKIAAAIAQESRRRVRQKRLVALLLLLALLAAWLLNSSGLLALLTSRYRLG
jgi:hypothetical protein